MEMSIGTKLAATLLSLSAIAVHSLAAAAPEALEVPVVPGRHALVIGNDAYAPLVRLPSAGEDERRVSQQLTALGFEVMPVKVVTSADSFYNVVLKQFAQRVQPGDVVVFYFSGHGFSYGADNFIAPLDTPQALTRNQLAERTIPVQALQDYLAQRQPGVLLTLIDACRTIAGFVIQEADGSAADAKSMVLPSGPGPTRSSMLTGFATSGGTPAAANSKEGEASIFTRALASRIAAAGRDFHDVFVDVAIDVRQLTSDKQIPGMVDWSTTTLYLNPDPHWDQLEHDAWLTALTTGTREAVDYYARRHAASNYADAARRWLADPRNGTVATAAASPEAVERAWNLPAPLLAQIADANFAFAAVAPSSAVQGPATTTLGVGNIVGVDTLSAKLGRLAASGRIVTTQDLVAREAPSSTARALVLVPAGRAVDVAGSQRRSADGRSWLDVQLSPDGQRGYLPLAGGRDTQASPPVSLGGSLREIVVPPMPDGLPDLVDPAPIREAVAQLAAQGRHIGWVSLAIGAKPRSDTERLDRRARLNHAVYLLRQAGIAAGRITAVTAAPDLPGDGVRIRFFGL
jgi:hypothetical protein